MIEVLTDIDIVTGIFIVVIVVAAVVALISLYVMRAPSKNGVTQTEKQLSGDTETKTTPLRQGWLSSLRASFNFKRRLSPGKGRTSRKRDASPEPETNDVPPSPDPEAPNVAPVNEEETMANTVPAEPGQGTPNVAPVNEEETMANTVSTESAPEETKETAEDEPQPPAAIKDSLQDLFATEVVEEGDVSKLAKELNNVDVRDLLEEARNLINQFNQNGKR